MENVGTRSTSPSRFGKRKTEIHDDFEPPRKSPAGTPVPSPHGTPLPSPGHSPLGSPSHSPCRTPVGSRSPLSYNCDDHSPSHSRQGSFKRKTIRASRNVTRRQSTGDVTWSPDSRSPSPGCGFTQTCSQDTPSFASLAKQYKDCKADEEGQESQDTFGDIPSFGSKPSFQNYRPGSKDLLDDYLARKKDARRRSSCKEITFQLLRQDTAEMKDPDEPRFRLLERQRRLTIANKLLESISDSCESLSQLSPNLLGTLTVDNLPSGEELDLSKSPSLRLRSRSAEGYDPTQVKDKTQETRALMFDSVPDLKDEEERHKFQAVRRNKRRGAVCYDEDNALSLLQNLNISDLNISSDLSTDINIEESE